jgi:hypothetical protein
MTTSGNLLTALQKNATGLADQTYQNWIQNLSNTAGMGLSATGQAAQGIAGGNYNLANLAQNYGQSQANVYGNVASGEMNANQMVAQGQAQGASNLLGAGLSLATLGLGGNPFGGGSLMGGKGGTGGSFNLASTPIGQIGSGMGNFFGGLFNQGSSTA